MEMIERVVRRSFLYGVYKALRAWKIRRQWTDQDKLMNELYAQFVLPGQLCFDVGANLGNWTRVFLRRGARVVAVEPQEECLQYLRWVYGKNKRLTIVPQALGETQGQAELWISGPHTLSSMCPEWIEALRKSGRFGQYTWDRKQTVSVTTLDQLIEQYGMPSFIKIDVEGYEYQVLKGLSKQVQALSFEFAPECLESALRCMDHLQDLGEICANYSLCETMRLCLERWVHPRELIEILSGLRGDSRIFGDVYVRSLSPPIAGPRSKLFDNASVIDKKCCK